MERLVRICRALAAGPIQSVVPSPGAYPDSRKSDDDASSPPHGTPFSPRAPSCASPKSGGGGRRRNALGDLVSGLIGAAWPSAVDVRAMAYPERPHGSSCGRGTCGGSGSCGGGGGGYSSSLSSSSAQSRHHHHPAAPSYLFQRQVPWCTCPPPPPPALPEPLPARPALPDPLPARPSSASGVAAAAAAGGIERSDSAAAAGPAAAGAGVEQWPSCSLSAPGSACCGLSSRSDSGATASTSCGACSCAGGCSAAPPRAPLLPHDWPHWCVPNSRGAKRMNVCHGTPVNPTYLETLYASHWEGPIPMASALMMLNPLEAHGFRTFFLGGRRSLEDACEAFLVPVPQHAAARSHYHARWQRLNHPDARSGRRHYHYEVWVVLLVTEVPSGVRWLWPVKRESELAADTDRLFSRFSDVLAHADGACAGHTQI